jgi:hypothetical protein
MRRLNRLAQPRLLLRTDLEIVLEDDRLAVEVKVLVVRIGVEQIEQPIDERDEPEAELLVREVPLAIPMRVRNDVNVQHLSLDRSGREAGDEVALEEDEDGDDRHQRDEAGGGEQVPVGVVAALKTEQPSGMV